MALNIKMQLYRYKYIITAMAGCAAVIIILSRECVANQIIHNARKSNYKIPIYARMMGIAMYGEDLCYYKFPVGPYACLDSNTKTIYFEE
jgi:hypothetical protein